MKIFNKNLPRYFPRLLAKSYNQKEWQLKNFALQRVRLNNKKLAKDFENLCRNKENFLTFGEFVREEMLGKNGYHNSHKYFGKTNVDEIWPMAILNICRENSIDSVLEIGSGDGTLGIKTLKLAKKYGVHLSWIGVEINEKLNAHIKEITRKNSFINFKPLVSLGKIPQSKYLLIYSFSLDSMANEVAINTGVSISPANALLGIKIDKGILEEIILNEGLLKKRGLLFKKGVLSLGKITFDLSSWKLQPYQRVYIPIHAYLSILDSLKRLKDSSIILIIDEIKPPPFKDQAYHFATPRVLNKSARDYNNLYDAYRDAGNNLWYFPFYLKPFIGFIKQAGFKNVVFDIDIKMASKLAGKKWNKPGLYLCNAIIGRYEKRAEMDTFNISAPT